MNVVMPIAAQQGYTSDVSVCSDEVPAGRPAPWSNLRAAQLLNVYPMNSIVVVDDTPVGIQAARNAGMFPIAVSMTGNSLGLSQQEVAALPIDELQNRLEKIDAEFLSAGAAIVIRSVADLPGVLDLAIS